MLLYVAARAAALGKLSDSARESWLADADAVIRELDSHGWLIDPESGERHQNRVNDVLKTSNHHYCVRGMPMSDPHPRRMMSQATHAAATSRAATTTSARHCSSVFSSSPLSGVGSGVVGIAPSRVDTAVPPDAPHRPPVATTIPAGGMAGPRQCPATHGGVPSTRVLLCAQDPEFPVRAG